MHVFYSTTPQFPHYIVLLFLLFHVQTSEVLSYHERKSMKSCVSFLSHDGMENSELLFKFSSSHHACRWRESKLSSRFSRETHLLLFSSCMKLFIALETNFLYVSLQKLFISPKNYPAPVAVNKKTTI
jgi:hypothetical protein